MQAKNFCVLPTVTAEELASKINLNHVRIQIGGGGCPDPRDFSADSQKYRVSQQYWSGSPEITKLPSQHSFKWRFADGSIMTGL